MKHNNIILSLMAILILATTTHAGNFSAFEGTTDTLDLSNPTLGIGYGVCSNYVTDSTDDLITLSVGSGTSKVFYVSVKYAGNTSWSINAHNAAGEMKIYGIQLAVDKSYTELDCGVIPDDNLTTNISCYSNIGYYYLSMYSSLGSKTGIYNLTHSNVTYTVIEDLVYSAGERAYLPFLTRYENCTGDTSIHNTLVNVLGKTLYSDDTDDNYYPVNFTLDCNDYGVTYMNFLDYEEPTLINYQAYNKGIVITPRVELNFTSIYPTNGTTIKADIGEVITFTVTPNLPTRVDYVSFYKDGELIQYTTNNYTLSEQFTEAGNYTIEAQLEDNDCGFYPTATWNVEVGQIITLSGYVKEYGTNTPLEATIWLTGGNCLGDCTVNSNASGYYSIGVAEEDNYTITAYKVGYSSQTATKTMVYGSFYNTQYIQNFNLNRTTTGHANIHAYDYDTNTLLGNYRLDLYRASQLVTTIINGAVTYNASPYNQIVEDSGNPTYIMDMLQDYSYRAVITKSGYEDSGELDKPSTYTWTQGIGTQQVYLYLKQPQNITSTMSVNWSDLSPINGATIDASYGIYYPISGTATTDTNSYYLCIYVQENGGTWYNDCTYDKITGIETVQMDAYLEPDKVYNYYLTAIYDLTTQFNSPTISFYTNGTPPTTTTSTYIIPPSTTTTTYTIPTNQSFWNGTHNQKEYNCTDPWGLIKDKGDWYHGSICAYVRPLGVDWTYGLTFLLIVMYVYIRTRSSIAIAIISLLLTATFYEYMPQPTLTLLAVGLAFSIGFAIYGLYFEPYKREKDKYLNR